jgi:hypothetical protein
MIAKKILLGTFYYSGMGVLFNVGLGRRRGIISLHNVLDEVLLKEPYLYCNAVSTRIYGKQIQNLADHWTVQPAAKINDHNVKGLFSIKRGFVRDGTFRVTHRHCSKITAL